MATLIEQLTQLRAVIGETIPSGGSAEDTLFSDNELMTVLTAAGENPTIAAKLAWEQKAAHYSNLVDITDGNASRKMSDLLDNAMKMVEYYGSAAKPATATRTRIGRVRRPW